MARIIKGKTLTQWSETQGFNPIKPDSRPASEQGGWGAWLNHHTEGVRYSNMEIQRDMVPRDILITEINHWLDMCGDGDPSAKDLKADALNYLENMMNFMTETYPADAAAKLRRALSVEKLPWTESEIGELLKSVGWATKGTRHMIRGQKKFWFTC